VLHPVTGERMFLPGRMAAFVPVNTPVTVGMLLARTPVQNVFWQWVNQSVNVVCNYVNRSGASVDASQLAQAYGLAVGVSCSIAVGARRLVERGPPWVRRLGLAVPYAAVVSAGAANVAFTRLPELQHGAPIAAPDGAPLGTSAAAARSAVLNTVLSRNVLLPIIPMLLPPLLSTALRSVVPLGAVGAIAAETTFVACSSAFALPVAIAVFPQARARPRELRPPAPPRGSRAAPRRAAPPRPVRATPTPLPPLSLSRAQEMRIPIASLEPEFQGARDAAGEPIKYVLCNKGL
jgi:hypothetical protein